MPRIVLDTNVIVRRLLQKGIDRDFTIVTPDLILKKV